MESQAKSASAAAPVKRGRGRPRKSEQATTTSAPGSQQKRRRGRPPGSTNKAKTARKATSSNAISLDSQLKNLIAKAQKSTKSQENGVSSNERLSALLQETTKELNTIEPRLEQFQEVVNAYEQLRLERQRLMTLKLSLQSILDNFEVQQGASASRPGRRPGRPAAAEGSQTRRGGRITQAPAQPKGNFSVPLAIEAMNRQLRHPESLNGEIFKAVVEHSGEAHTQDIKDYLVNNDIRQPGNGETFQNVPLAAIYARVNYLVRKDLLTPIGKGRFRSAVGWE